MADENVEKDADSVNAVQINADHADEIDGIDRVNSEHQLSEQGSNTIWSLRGFSDVDNWTKFSIFVFSALSFLTTMNGMRIFFPADEAGVLGIVGSILASLAVQALMLSFAFRVKQEGVKKSLILMYSIAAIVSMSFSYIGLFKYYSGGFLNEEQRELFDQEFMEYSKALGTHLATARNEVEQAIRVVAEAVDAESSRGGATALKSTSPYFNALLDEAGLDLRERSSYAGEGPIFNWLKGTSAALDSQAEQLDVLHELHMDLTQSDVLFRGSRESKVNAAYTFETAADWQLIERIVSARGLEFRRPKLPVMPQVGGASGSGATRHDEIKWSVDAFRALRSEWNNAVVAIPIVVAIALDLVILLIAILFRDSTRLRPDQVAIRKSITQVLETLRLPDNELSSGLHAILHFADSRGSGGKKNWTLHADRIERMSPSGKVILLQLARSRLAKEPWYKEYLVLSDDVHDCLNDYYAYLLQRDLSVGS